MKEKEQTAKMNRRAFLNRSAFSLAAVSVVPGHVLGLNGATPPSGKLNIAGIGVGGRGGGVVAEMAKSENIVALCDVDWRHAARVFRTYEKATQYKDYRRMFDTEKGIDAVVVGTPDHSHAFTSMAAMRRGIHVYCEKPLTHSVWEARQVAQAARKYKVATQMGNQGQASEETRRLSELVWGNAIGPVTEAHIWTDRPSNGLFKIYWPQGVDRPEATPPVPQTLDWDLWIGPAPYREYNPIYAPFQWRGWWDFGTGALGDIGCHSFDPVFRALKLGHPISVEGASTLVNEETYPVGSIVTYQFPARGDMPPCKLVWYDGGLRPPRPAGLEDGEVMGSGGHLLVGKEGFMINNRIFPSSRRGEFSGIKKSLKRSPGHYQEFIDACKGGEPAGSNFDWAGPLTEVVLLGNVTLRKQLRESLTTVRLQWDPEKLEFTNMPEANTFLRREYREGWEL